MGIAGDAASRRLYFELQRTAARLRATADSRCRAAAGVSAAQAGALFAIEQEEGPSQRRIAELLEQRETATTTMVTRLVAAGLVERRPSHSDARVWNIHLTDAGRQALTRVRSELDDLNESIDVALDGNVDSFADALTDLRRINSPT